MSTPTRDRRGERRTRTQAEILDAAWALADRHGLASWTLRDLAAGVGMQAPSLYVYFDSKTALYDALFAQGYQQLLDRIASASRAGPPGDVLRRAAHLFVDFAVERPARYALLFLGTLPGFAPSPRSYALAQQVLEELEAVLASAGAAGAEAGDMFTALMTGLASQQVSNDPRGTRWVRLVDDAVDMFLAAFAPVGGRP